LRKQIEFSRMYCPAMRIIGLHRVSINGLNRELRLAARITAFISPPL
jgi:hypothetical protein